MHDQALGMAAPGTQRFLLQDVSNLPEATKATKSEKADRQKRADTAGKGPSSLAAGAQQGGSGRPSSAVVGNTVFVRGLAADVTKQQLQARLQSFGPVSACR